MVFKVVRRYMPCARRRLAWLLRAADIVRLKLYAESDIVLCNKCEAALAKTDTVLDALRVGQEALDKAVSIRMKGDWSLKDTAFINFTALTLLAQSLQRASSSQPT